MSAKIGQVFKPGDKCVQSGIYEVIHDREHVQRHEVTVVYDETSPPCNHCGPHPRFKLVRIAQHVKNHNSFKKKAA
jgi:hypothetical protein